MRVERSATFKNTVAVHMEILFNFAITLADLLFIELMLQLSHVKHTNSQTLTNKSLMNLNRLSTNYERKGRF